MVIAEKYATLVHTIFFEDVKQSGNCLKSVIGFGLVAVTNELSEICM
jgi:hypothetical protein